MIITKVAVIMNERAAITGTKRAKGESVSLQLACAIGVLELAANFNPTTQHRSAGGGGGGG